MDNINTSKDLMDVVVSNWLYDVSIYNTKGVTYLIHKTQEQQHNWLFTNFNFNLTNIDLKTADIKIAEKRAIVILNTKMSHIDRFITSLTKLTKKIKRNSIRLSPEFTKRVENFIDSLESTGIM